MNPQSSATENTGLSAEDGAKSVLDPLQWMLDKGEEAAAITIGLTILNVNRLQVYRRDLASAFDARSETNRSKAAEGPADSEAG